MARKCAGNKFLAYVNFIIRDQPEPDLRNLKVPIEASVTKYHHPRFGKAYYRHYGAS
jgi:hypothetical protein